MDEGDPDAEALEDPVEEGEADVPSDEGDVGDEGWIPPELEWEACSLYEGEADGLADGERLAEGDALGLKLADGERLAEGDALGEADGEQDSGRIRYDRNHRGESQHPI